VVDESACMQAESKCGAWLILVACRHPGATDAVSGVEPKYRDVFRERACGTNIAFMDIVSLMICRSKVLTA
jgi:hypothetical protein